MAETAIKHGLCALGALHYHIRQRKSGHAPGVSNVPIKHYSLAVSAMATAFDRDDTALAVALISCLIFAMFESFQGHHTYALLHIKYGSKLLYSMTHQSGVPDSSDPGRCTQRTHFQLLLIYTRRIFLRFVRQIKELGRAFPVGDTSTEGLTRVPSLFQDVDEASRVFEDIHLASVETLIPRGCRLYKTRAMRNQTMEAIKAWSDALDAYTIRLDRMQAEQNVQPQLLALLVYRHAFTIALQTVDLTWETDFDRFIPEFRKIVSLAGRLIDKLHTKTRNVIQIFKLPGLRSLPARLCQHCTSHAGGVGTLGYEESP